MSEGAQKTFTDDSVQIVLIGATGSGKSSSGNTILGNKHFFATTSAKSITLECQSATVTVNGRQVTVVDTPGWDCTELSEDEVAKRIRHYLQTLHGPYSFLLVIRIGSEECDEVRKIYKLREVLGSSYLQHTTILFSHIDNLEWETIDEFLEKRKKEFKTLLEHCKHSTSRKWAPWK
uniref:AIG1-type G domain-containing protein n=1 Tax=Electrophorus electricus TaxID=8005 RepID=A0A4W4FVF3_ELEEL